VSTTEQQKAIKALAKAVPQCNRPQSRSSERSTSRRSGSSPSSTPATTGGDTEYVARQGFFLGHGLLPNRGYKMLGYSHPHPKNQATVHLLSEAEPAQDNISAFSMTPELHDSLKVFQAPDVEAVAGRSTTTSRRASTGSRTASTCRSPSTSSGTASSASTSTAPSSAAAGSRRWSWAIPGRARPRWRWALLGHYRLGERVQGEQTSMAGLIGGLEKMGDTWMLSWGRIPLNDKRLLVVDETQGLAPEPIEAMSDVRATGVAEITKIRTERTNARCRIVVAGQPDVGPDARPAQPGRPRDQGAVQEARGHPPARLRDRRRVGRRRLRELDQRPPRGAAAPKYSSEACRSLVLWAWSPPARPDRLHAEATDAILAAATDMGRRYHPSIPLVEPSDQRLKLARLAAAAAAGYYSTDDGEKLIVGLEHVAFVVDYLERIYTAGRWPTASTPTRCGRARA
jgi:hypothetical protein